MTTIGTPVDIHSNALEQARRGLVATRVSAREKSLVEALAKTEGRTITDMVYEMVMPEVRSRLRGCLDQSGVLP